MPKSAAAPDPADGKFCPGGLPRYLCALVIWALFSTLSQPQPHAQGSLPVAPEKLRIIVYNVENQAASTVRNKSKSDESHEAVINVIAHLAPDIAVLAEVLGEAAYQEMFHQFKNKGLNFEFGTIVKGQDAERNLVVFSKFRPVEVKHELHATYRINDLDVRVRRGFAYCVFRWRNGYQLHLVGAHLKSKVFHALGQTDMRRYEARLLRYLVDDILKKDPQANILVLGDFNDQPDSSPLNTLFSRRSNPPRQLYDLRPVDGQNQSWTHFWDANDIYSRIDYILTSHGILPEIIFSKTLIPDIAETELASDHRPLLVEILLQDKPHSEELYKLFDRNIRIPESPRSSLQEGRVIGSRKARRN